MVHLLKDNRRRLKLKTIDKNEKRLQPPTKKRKWKSTRVAAEADGARDFC